MEERKLILKMVDEGKITAEEGAKLLAALQPSADSGKSTSKSSNGESRTTRLNEQKEHQQTDNQSTFSQSSLSTKVDWEEGNRRFDDWEREKQKQKADFTSTFTSFIDHAIQKIKDMDLDFNFGSYQEIHHIFQHKQLEQTVIDVSLENGSLELRPWQERDVKVICDAKVYKESTPEKARQAFLNDTVFEVKGNELRFYTKTKAIKVHAVMYIPKKTYERIHLYTFNGHLNGEEVVADRFSGKAANGSMTMNKIDVMRFEAETVNGPIKITSSQLDTADVKTMNGSIELNSSIRDVEAESVNGTIECSLDITQDARAELEATTGSIFVTIPESIRTEGLLKTNVGNYNCTLADLDVIEEKKDFIQKSMKFTANEAGTPRLKLDADTKTGSITVKSR